MCSIFVCIFVYGVVKLYAIVWIDSEYNRSQTHPHIGIFCFVYNTIYDTYKNAITVLFCASLWIYWMLKLSLELWSNCCLYLEMVFYFLEFYLGFCGFLSVVLTTKTKIEKKTTYKLYSYGACLTVKKKSFFFAT